MSPPAMVKTEALDPELAEIIWGRFNFPWCTGYSTKCYQRGIDLLIHKYPNYFCLHILHPIPLLDIKASMRNKHIGRMATSQDENIDGIYPKQYSIRKSKAADIQALNTRLFYNHS